MSTNWWVNWMGPSNASIALVSRSNMSYSSRYKNLKKKKKSFEQEQELETVQRTQALLNCLAPMIRVLSIMSLPGPEATHSSVRLLQVDVSTSQGSPVSKQWGPWVLGDTSPRLDWPKAAMNEPCEHPIIPLIDSSIHYVRLTFPGMTESPFIRASKRRAAYPLLSDDINRLVLFILVQWTAYQLRTPMGSPSLVRTNFSCTMSLSVS